MENYADDIKQLKDGSAYYPKVLKAAAGEHVQLNVTVQGAGAAATTTAVEVSSGIVETTLTTVPVATGGQMEVSATASDSSVTITAPVNKVLPVLEAGQKSTWTFDVAPADNGNFSIYLTFYVFRQGTTDVLAESDPANVPAVALQVSNTVKHWLTDWTDWLQLIGAFIGAVLAILAAVIPSWRTWIARKFKRSAHT